MCKGEEKNKSFYYESLKQQTLTVCAGLFIKYILPFLSFAAVFMITCPLI